MFVLWFGLSIQSNVTGSSCVTLESWESKNCIFVLYLAAEVSINVVTRAVPFTSKGYAGDAVPIPTLPLKYVVPVLASMLWS